MIGSSSAPPLASSSALLDQMETLMDNAVGASLRGDLPSHDIARLERILSDSLKKLSCGNITVGSKPSNFPSASTTTFGTYSSLTKMGDHASAQMDGCSSSVMGGSSSGVMGGSSSSVMGCSSSSNLMGGSRSSLMGGLSAGGPNTFSNPPSSDSTTPGSVDEYRKSYRDAMNSNRLMGDASSDDDYIDGDNSKMLSEREIREKQDLEFAMMLQAKEEEEAHLEKEKQRQEAEDFEQLVARETQCQRCGQRLDLSHHIDPYMLLACEHRFCTACLVGALKDDPACHPDPGIAYFCPVPHCRAQIAESELRDLLTDQEYAAYENCCLNSYLKNQGNTVVKCPADGCGYVMERLDPSTLSQRPMKAATGEENFSPEAANHKERCRFRCRKCNIEFCSDCGSIPYHLGFTCESHKKFLASRHCRFCDAAIESRGGSNAQNDVCTSEECLHRAEIICRRQHQCGHQCGGVRGESSCLPCLQPNCIDVAIKAGKLSGIKEIQNAEDFCNICYVEGLGAAPAVQIKCGHIFHFECIQSRLKKRWTGARMTFGFLNCPLCSQLVDHPSLADTLKETNALFDLVKAKCLERLKFENLDQDPQIINSGSRFFKKPVEFGLKKFAYYICFKCKSPYFGGHRSCEDNAEDDREFDATELVCPGCVSEGAGVNCTQHSSEFVEYKCRFCCNIASWFCWGSTHFCDDCHKKQGTPEAMTKKRKQDLPKCRGGKECPLKLAQHPPSGEEFRMGCGICRNLSTM